jgi:hypothetical protein
MQSPTLVDSTVGALILDDYHFVEERSLASRLSLLTEIIIVRIVRLLLLRSLLFTHSARSCLIGLAPNVEEQSFALEGLVSHYSHVPPS